MKQRCIFILFFLSVTLVSGALYAQEELVLEVENYSMKNGQRVLRESFSYGKEIGGNTGKTYQVFLYPEFAYTQLVLSLSLEKPRIVYPSPQDPRRIVDRIKLAGWGVQIQMISSSGGAPGQSFYLDSEPGKPAVQFILETAELMRYKELLLTIYLPAELSVPPQQVIVPLAQLRPEASYFSTSARGAAALSGSSYFVVVASATSKKEEERKKYLKYIDGKPGLVVGYLNNNNPSYPVQYAIGIFDSKTNAESFRVSLMNGREIKGPFVREVRADEFDHNSFRVSSYNHERQSAEDSGLLAMDYATQPGHSPDVQAASPPRYFESAAPTPYEERTSTGRSPLYAQPRQLEPAGTAIYPGSAGGSPGYTQPRQLETTPSVPGASQNLYAIELGARSTPPQDLFSIHRRANVGGMPYFEKAGGLYRVRIGFFTSFNAAYQASIQVSAIFPDAKVIREDGYLVNAEDFQSAFIHDRGVQPVAAPRETGPIYHTVKDGETLYSISEHYDVTLEEIRRLNNLGQYEVVIPGQKVRIQ